MADRPTVQRAVAGAVAAQHRWASRAASQRGQVLLQVATQLRQHADRIARLLTAEQGKPYQQALAEVEYAASFFTWFGEQARRIEGRLAPHPDGDRHFVIEHKPIGVAGLITPWNFPLAQGAKKISAALAAGCAAVWKPSEWTPLTALCVAPLLQAAGVPDGLVQILPGLGDQVGSALAQHPDVRLVSVTGSVATGSKVMQSAAADVKRVSLELGGNAPFIILPDADLDQVADQLIVLKTFVSGQVCVTANRIYVPQAIVTPLTQKLSNRLDQLRIGNGLDPEVQMGPLIHAQAVEKVQRLVSDAIQQGAKIIQQNHRFQESADLRQENFCPAILLGDVRDDMAIARQEIFGPVLPLITYQRPVDVVQAANDTPYGLAAYVYGSDLAVCHAVARQLEVGIVGINEWRPLKAEIPFGGVKQSGFGSEGGYEGLHEYQTTQVISMPHPKLP